MASIRKQITQPLDLMCAVEQQLCRDGETNLSRWIADCIIPNLDADLRRGLAERPVVGRHTKGAK